MASFDQKSNIDAQVALNIQTIASDTTTNGVKIDTQGYEAVTFVIQAGVVTAGDVTALIEESSDNTTFTPVSDTFLIGTEADTNLDASHEIARIGYVGKERYVRLSAVTDNSANLLVGAQVLLGRPKTAPVA